ncbi:TPA: hypothetical protein U0V61_004626 [Escherichia coli]|nr:hypothetical protein [Escherichia marmotae]HAY0228439.1 hypothetical protein [Escherichia coli]HEL8020802.1 hypothetical protein [Escherichia coli]HEL8087171.1 hypothetical protein [Escherichia coli]HEL8092308.1 hypothetical protein [Escherichia coli]
MVVVDGGSELSQLAQLLTLTVLNDFQKGYKEDNQKVMWPVFQEKISDFHHLQKQTLYEVRKASILPAKCDGSASGFFFPAAAESFHGRWAYLALICSRCLQGVSAGYFPEKGDKIKKIIFGSIIIVLGWRCSATQHMDRGLLALYGK